MGSASVHRCRLLLRSHVLLQALAGAAAFVGPLGPAPRAPPRAPALRGSGLRVPGCAAAGARRARVASGAAGLAAQIKFADAVEEILVRKWDKKAVSRVVKSWRRMDEDYIHKQFWDEHDTWQVMSECCCTVPVQRPNSVLTPAEQGGREWADCRSRPRRRQAF